MKTVEEVISEIDHLLESNYGPGSTDVVAVRRSALIANRKFLKAQGFPVSLQDKAYLNFYSTFFQEANYDGLDLSDQGEDLGSLDALVQINCYTFFGGRGTRELTPDEFARFSRFSQSMLGPRYTPPPSRWPGRILVAAVMAGLAGSILAVFRYCL